MEGKEGDEDLFKILTNLNFDFLKKPFFGTEGESHKPVFISHSKSIKLNDNAEMGVIFYRVDFPRIPRRLVNTLFSRQILILVLMYPMTEAYGSFH